MNENELRGRVLSTMRTKLQEMRFTASGMLAQVEESDLADCLLDFEAALATAQADCETVLAANT